MSRRPVIPDPQVTLDLQSRAAQVAQGLPALILAAERLALSVTPGAHGLRRTGTGEEFWQYRPTHAGDAAQSIDWRRSARSDATFVRQHEVQTAQSALIWVDPAATMAWRGGPDRPEKGDRARLLALALAMVLLRGGEKVALAGQMPRPGRVQADRIAQGLYEASPLDQVLRPLARAVVISDFMDDPAPVLDLIRRGAAMGVRGALFQVLDPDEESFPYDGAVQFDFGPQSHRTRDAGGLRAAYLDRLSQRRATLTRAAGAAGWSFGTHDTASPAASALMWLYQVVE